MRISNNGMAISYKTVNCGIFAMNDHNSVVNNNGSDMKTESADAFRFFVHRGLYG
jgi:hypothetical protein